MNSEDGSPVESIVIKRKIINKVQQNAFRLGGKHFAYDSERSAMFTTVVLADEKVEFPVDLEYALASRYGTYV